jgi:hypothetical protein
VASIRVFATSDGKWIVLEGDEKVPDAKVVETTGHNAVQSHVRDEPLVPGARVVTVVMPDGREFRNVTVESWKLP